MKCAKYLTRNKKWIHISTIAYTTWLLIWFGLWLVVGDGIWWMTLLNRIVPYMLIPTPFIILLAIVSRQRKLIGVAFIPLLIFGVLYWPYLLPHLVQTDIEPHLKVMTYNVLFSNANYDAVGKTILTYRPDLIALQEVQPKMMSELTEQLDDLYPYSLMGDEHPFGTTAAFSRYPVLDSYTLDLETDRPAVLLKINVDGEEITFISAHLLAYGLQWVPLLDIPQIVNLRTFNQNRQAYLLLEEAKKQDGIVIIACDCNTKETSSSHRILNNAMTNAAREVGWIIGGPMLDGARQDIGLQHIDYIFFQGPLRPIEVYSVKDSGGSDHFPILALFNFATVAP